LNLEAHHLYRRRFLKQTLRRPSFSLIFLDFLLCFLFNVWSLKAHHIYWRRSLKQTLRMPSFSLIFLDFLLFWTSSFECLELRGSPSLLEKVFKRNFKKTFNFLNIFRFLLFWLSYFQHFDLKGSPSFFGKVLFVNKLSFSCVSFPLLLSTLCGFSFGYLLQSSSFWIFPSVCWLHLKMCFYMPFLHYLAMVYNRSLKKFTSIIYNFDLNGFHHLSL